MLCTYITVRYMISYNHTVYSHKALGFRPCAITPKESILTYFFYSFSSFLHSSIPCTPFLLLSYSLYLFFTPFTPFLLFLLLVLLERLVKQPVIWRRCAGPNCYCRRKVQVHPQMGSCS